MMTSATLIVTLMVRRGWSWTEYAVKDKDKNDEDAGKFPLVVGVFVSRKKANIAGANEASKKTRNRKYSKKRKLEAQRLIVGAKKNTLNSSICVVYRSVGKIEDIGS